MYEIAQIWRYPIKSCRGLQVTEAALGPDGLELDRRWMVVNADGRFLTQRTHRLEGVIPSLTADGLTIRCEGMDGEAFLPRDGWQTDVLRNGRVWKHEEAAHDQGAEVADLLSAFLGEPVRLPFQANDHTRIPKRRPEGIVTGLSFADAYPLLIVGEASLAALNRELPTGIGPIGVERFRPNLVVRTRVPWEEDTWNWFDLGVRMDGVKRCDRCPIIRVDPNDGTRHPTEPTETLTRIHHVDGRPLFGLYVIHEGTGILRVGDRVEAIAFGDPPEP